MTKSPGVYVEERTYAKAGAGVAETTVGIVGPAVKGPLGITLVTSQKELISVFGEPSLKDCTISAAHKILEKCNRVYVGRVVPRAAVGSTATVLSDGNSVLEVTSKTVGNYLDGYKLTVKTTDFEARLEDAEGKVLESITAVDFAEFKEKLLQSKYYDVVSEDLTENLDAISGAFSGGTDTMEGITVEDYKGVFKLFENLDAYQIDILTAPGIINTKNEAAPFEGTIHQINALLISTAKARKSDCVAMLEIPQWYTTPAQVQAFADAEEDNVIKYNSDVAQFWWPNIYVNDDVLNQAIILPASVYAIRGMIVTDKTVNFWSAPAGLTRGQLEGISGVTYNLSQEDRDVLLAGTHVVNPITTYRGRGPVLFGNSTTLRDKSKPLAAINVRRLVSKVQREVQALSATLLFELADEYLWERWKMLVKPYLDNIKQQHGLYDYRLVMDSSNNTADDMDNARLNGTVYLKPVKACDDIEIEFVLTPSGVELA